MRIELSTATKEEIIKFAQDYVDQEFFGHLPELKEQVSVVLTGSIPLGNYDAESDIDLNFIFPEDVFINYSESLRKFKTQLVESSPQVQPFFKDTFENLQTLFEWRDDHRLKEFATGIILYDPSGKFSDFQEKITWYPDEIFREKIHWLFAEIVFEFDDRWKTASRRGDSFFLIASKLRIVSLITNTLFLLNHKYPVGDKQLFNELRKLPNNQRQIKDNVLKVISSNDLQEVNDLLKRAIGELEDELIERGLIEEKENKYWIDLRPKYKVEI